MIYLLISFLLIFSILFVFFLAVRINLLFKRSYEKRFQEAFNYDESNQTDMAIDKYKAVIGGAKGENPILINTYLLLADAYHEKGPEYDQLAIDAIDNALKIIRNKKINQEEIYLKSALIYKADFLKKTTYKDEFKNYLIALKQEFPEDQSFQSKIGQRLQQIDTPSI